jgi:hypothetical protein
MYTLGMGGVDRIIVFSKTLHQSIEGSKKSLLEVGFSDTQRYCISSYSFRGNFFF